MGSRFIIITDQNSKEKGDSKKYALTEMIDRENCEKVFFAVSLLFLFEAEIRQEFVCSPERNIFRPRRRAV